MNKNSFTGKILAGVFVIIAVTAFSPSASIGLDKMSKFIEYKSSEDFFKCNIPTNWSIYAPGFGLSPAEKKVYGITLFGPPTGSPVSAVISVHYYAPGNLLHKTREVFINRHSGPVLGFVAEGKSYGDVREIEFAARKAQTFDRIDVRFIGERALHPLKVSIFEKFIVIPGIKDEGFYVLKLSTPAADKDKYTGIFEEIVKSFLPER